MIKKFSLEWYRAQVDAVITATELNERGKRRIVVLMNDTRLTEIEKRTMKQWNEALRALEKTPADLQRRREYTAATLQISQSPWRALRIHIEKLPLVALFELAGSSPEIRMLFVERLKEADDSNRKAVSQFRQSLERFWKTFSDDDLMNRTMKRKHTLPRDVAQAVEESRPNELPHPLGAIVRDSTKGGGKLGATKLAKKLDEYCTDQLKGYIDWSTRTRKAEPSQTKTMHMGKINAMGVLTTIYSPEKAKRRLEDAIARIHAGERREVFLITTREIERVIDSPMIKKYLAKLT